MKSRKTIIMHPKGSWIKPSESEQAVVIPIKKRDNSPEGDTRTRTRTLINGFGIRHPKPLDDSRRNRRWFYPSPATVSIAT